MCRKRSKFKEFLVRLTHSAKNHKFRGLIAMKENLDAKLSNLKVRKGCVQKTLGKKKKSKNLFDLLATF